jgi:hypothetical protein
MRPEQSAKLLQVQNLKQFELVYKVDCTPMPAIDPPEVAVIIIHDIGQVLLISDVELTLEVQPSSRVQIDMLEQHQVQGAFDAQKEFFKANPVDPVAGWSRVTTGSEARFAILAQINVIAQARKGEIGQVGVP